ncbi:hypothetical protein ACIA5D_02630 [Actinoplanes sp. NPDC051513]|uniref:Gfo/Idh/MocA family protein n=1 Tax=Actinoplanes sp. NPDC051513 TaxID=3363908 RepID=UPI00378F2BB4
MTTDIIRVGVLGAARIAPMALLRPARHSAAVEVAAEARMAVPIPRPSDIRYRLDLAGGAMMDIGAYAVHMVRALTGAEPEVVGARAKLRGAGIDRAMTADLRFPDEVTGTIFASLWSSRVLRLSVRAIGGLPTVPQAAGTAQGED